MKTVEELQAHIDELEKQLADKSNLIACLEIELVKNFDKFDIVTYERVGNLAKISAQFAQVVNQPTPRNQA